MRFLIIGRMLASTFKKLVDLQRVTVYPFKVEPFTRRFLMYDTLILDEDKLWKASRICEPPENPTPKRDTGRSVIQLSSDPTSTSESEAAPEEQTKNETKPPETPQDDAAGSRLSAIFRRVFTTTDIK